MQNPICSAGFLAWRIDILNAYEPLPTLLPRLEVAGDGSKQGSEVQGARR